MNTFEEKYTTITTGATSLFKDRGSKFLGYAFPVHNIEEVKQKLQEVKKEHLKATHHCFAYRLGTEGLVFRANDDGEPAGSAGRPILGQIDSAGCTNTLIVVVRYYGRTMLGVPGLINAYKTAAAAALEHTGRTEKCITQTVKITTDYTMLSEVLYLLKQCEADLIKQDLQLFCTIIAGIPKVHYTACAAHLLHLQGLELEPISLPA